LVGITYVKTGNWHPFIPKNTGTFGQFGISGLFRGAAVIFFAYIGFDAVSTAAQEAKNPKRDLPRGILGSLIVCTILYILVALVLTGIVPFTLLGVPDPIAVGVDAEGAGDQGMMFGFACDETKELMPLPITIAHSLTKKIDSVRESGKLPFLRPDGKAQVVVGYEDGKPKFVSHVTIAVPHSEEVTSKQIYEDIYNEIIIPVL